MADAGGRAHAEGREMECRGSVPLVVKGLISEVEKWGVSVHAYR